MRRTFLVALILAACGGTAAPAPSSAPAKPAASASAPASATPGKISSFYSTVSATFTPMWIAKEAGIFQKNGLDVDVQLIQNPQGTAALLANQVQIGLGGAADVLGPITSGADLQLLATLTPTYPYIFEVADSIKTTADLKGQKLGASQAGGSDYVAMLAMLGKLGLDPGRDVNILFVGGIPQRTAALIGGNVAGTLTSPPETLVIEGKGYHPLVDLTTLKLPSASSTLMAHKAWIQANHGAVQKFVDSLVEAITREKADRAYAEQIMAKYLKLEDKAALAATYDFFALKILPTIPEVKAEQFKDAVDAIGKQNEKVRGLDLTTVIDNSFVEDAAKRGLAGKL
jgi:NitT/TauT family transport system substrate-binding protein